MKSKRMVMACALVAAGVVAVVAEGQRQAGQFDGVGLSIEAVAGRVHMVQRPDGMGNVGVFVVPEPWSEAWLWRSRPRLSRLACRKTSGARDVRAVLRRESSESLVLGRVKDGLVGESLAVEACVASRASSLALDHADDDRVLDGVDAEPRPCRSVPPELALG